MEYIKLTIPQQNIWNLQTYYEDSSISNICGVIYFEEIMDVKKAQQSINQVIAKQTGLRLQFIEQKGEPVQYVSEYIPVEIPVMEFETQDKLDAYIKQQALQPIAYRHIVRSIP